MNTPSPKQIRDQKIKMREIYQAKRQALAPEEKARRDKKICNAFLNLISYRYAKIILLYHPLFGEVDVRPIIIRALADGKAVALPRCNLEKRGMMDYHFIQSLDDLEEGAHGIMEPRTNLAKFDPDSASTGVLMAVPAFAYDKKGYRLGYGRGYYDRYLEHREFTTAGLIYSDFMEPTLPKNRFDLPVHFIITEKGVLIID